MVESEFVWDRELFSPAETNPGSSVRLNEKIRPLAAGTKYILP